jgi:hypothetical protein
MKALVALFEMAKTAVTSAIGLIIFVGIFLGPYLVYEVFPGQAYRISLLAAMIAIAVALVFLLLAVIPRVRAVSGYTLMTASFVVGLFVWIWSVIIVGQAWGIGVLYLLNFFLLIGSVVAAFFVLLLSHNWSALGQLIVILLIIWAFRLGGAALVGASK